MRSGVSNKIDMLPRFGIRLFMPKDFSRAEYFGYGPTESYIDKRQACYMGKFVADIGDMHEDYIRPQENSSHYGCRYLTVSSEDTSVMFTAGGGVFIQCVAVHAGGACGKGT